jgi:transcription elongation factor Elf1
MSKFTRTIEDFTCGHCGANVLGNGYTNHCPVCLWSKHVDINPGDRLNTCGGMMKPVAVEIDHGEYILIHRCENCGISKRNKTVPTDNFDVVVGLFKTP